MGGGFGQNETDLVISQSRPDPLNPVSGWRAYGENTSATTTFINVYAICMTTDHPAVIARVAKRSATKKGK